MRPTAGGGSSPSSPSSPSFSPTNLFGAVAQSQRSRVAPPQFNFQANYESDPVLARIKALGAQSVGNAQSEAAKLRKQAILDTGLTDVGREIGVDENTLTAASGNPTSLLAQLARESQQRSRDLDESLNQENLFWSGARANRLGELATGRAEAEAALTRDLRNALAGIDSGLLSAQELATQQEQEALEETARQQREAALLAAIQASQAGTTVESGLGGFIPAPPTVGGQPSGGVEYSPGPTPAQVENMQSSGIDPSTGIYAPQPTMIQGPGIAPPLFGGEPMTVNMPNIPGATDIISSRSVSPVTLPQDLAPPSNLVFSGGGNFLTDYIPPLSAALASPYVPPAVVPQPNPVDPYALDNLMMELALAGNRGFF
jgi:hypothetical protein